jgi:hypothetical protein
MMLSKADFEELFPDAAPDAVAARGVADAACVAHREDDGGLVPDRPTGVVPLTAPARYARYKMPDPTIAFMRLAMMNANAMLGRYRRMTGG